MTTKTTSKTLEVPAVQLGIEPYEGFPSFAIPYCYTPNQLLDVVLREIKDRGVIRLVSHIMYRQIRTGDREGNPINPQVVFTYSELERVAGISRPAVAL